jgi:serine/threonine protein kinase
LSVQSLLNEYYQQQQQQQQQLPINSGGGSGRRVVFIDGVTKWARNETAKSSGRIVIDYPMQLRPPPLNETNATVDLTRYYQVADSKDHPTMERRKWPNHEFDPHCIPSAKWQSEFHPVCNDIHATVDIRQTLLSGELTLLSNKGFWRHAWRHNQTDNATGNNQSAVTVWKTFKYVRIDDCIQHLYNVLTFAHTISFFGRINHNFEEKYYEDNRVDAVAMERLTGSPYVINMYGFCGLTVVQEFAGRGELAHVMAGLRMNTTERLKLARTITIGLHHIQHIPADNDDNNDTGNNSTTTRYPTMVHNDLNLANLMFVNDDRPVWNDFNIAILLMKHNETGLPCRFYSHFPNPQWKSPEEQVTDDEESNSHPPIVDEKIDIYALGNVFYRMVAGGSPWKRPEAKKVYPDEKIVIANLKRYNGTLPTVPPHIVASATMDNDPALATLYQAMQDCYSFRAQDRPTTSQLIAYFDEALVRVQVFDDEHSANATKAEALANKAAVVRNEVERRATNATKAEAQANKVAAVRNEERRANATGAVEEEKKKEKLNRTVEVVINEEDRRTNATVNRAFGPEQSGGHSTTR